MERNTKIDIFKGICIVLMVLGHAWAPFIIFIYLFHIPAFFVASGYTYKRGQMGYFRWIGKKIVNLMLPFLVSNFVLIGLYECMDAIGIYQYVENDVRFNALEAMQQLLQSGTVRGFGGATWFLPVLFLCSVIYRTIDEIGGKVSRRIIPLMSFVVFIGGWIYTEKDVSRIWNVELALLAVGFFAFGNRLAEKQILEKSIDDRLMLPIAIIGTWFFGAHYYYDTGLSMNWPVRQFDEDLFVMLTAALMAMYCCWKVSEWLDGRKIISKIISFIGRRTYAILVWHFVAFKLEIVIVWLLSGMKDNDYLKEATPRYSNTGCPWLFFSVGAIVFCMILSKLSERNKVANFIVNGTYRTVDSRKEK